MLVQSSLVVVFFCVILVFVTKTCSGDDQEPDDPTFSDCKRKLYNCGSIQDVGYPFWGGTRPERCGRYDFLLTCINNQYSLLQISNQKFRLLEITQSNFTISVASHRMWDDICPANDEYRNITLDDSSPFSFSNTISYISIFYGCFPTVTSQVLDGFTCPGTSDGSRKNRTAGFYADVIVESTGECIDRINVPILQSSYRELWGGNLTLKDALNQGFEVQYQQDRASCLACEASGGVCGSRPELGRRKGPSYWDYAKQFICFCPHWSSDPFACHSGRKRMIRLAVTLGTSTLGVAALIVSLIICGYKKQLVSYKSAFLWSKRVSDDQSLEELIKRHGSLGPIRYRYADIKKMTNSFKDKLGQGGFGSVYKGKLLDGYPVAVKILNVLKGNGEDFINEVTSISQTSHVNIVTLKGYCLQGSKRALVYDFMPHGSLEKFICNETCPKVGFARLDWETMFRITVGIARGLEYLHSGCNIRILHFDIKPHNILLDEDFCPKISDFGLAKLCTGKESIVSMVGARGTVGYIAPEVFCRNFGGVSYKSDVYSYGMMILEMVGARKKLVEDEVGSTSSESYFPEWIYKRLEAGDDLKLHEDMTKDEKEITKKMTIVGLWCIQTDPSQRPAMGRVLEMLEGSVGSLDFPPQPFLSPPSRLVEEYSTTLTLS